MAAIMCNRNEVCDAFDLCWGTPVASAANEREDAQRLLVGVAAE